MAKRLYSITVRHAGEIIYATHAMACGASNARDCGRISYVATHCAESLAALREMGEHGIAMADTLATRPPVHACEVVARLSSADPDKPAMIARRYVNTRTSKGVKVMREFTLKINCDNAAFDGDAQHEISRILNLLARLMPALDNTAEGGLRDANGNRVGYWSYTIDES